MIFYTTLFFLLYCLLVDASSLDKQYYDGNKILEENVYLKAQIENIGKLTKEMDRKYSEIVRNLEAKIEGHEIKFQRMETVYTGEFHKMQAQIDKQEATIIVLKSTCERNNKEAIFREWDKHKNDNNTIFPQKVANSSRFAELIVALDSKTDEPKITKRDSKPLQQKNVRKRASIGTVAFATSLTTTLDHGAPGHVIAFDHVYTNEGNGYHGSDGIFVCPTPGMYLFSFTIHVNAVKFGGYHLVANGKEILRAYANKVHQTTNILGTTVVRLNAGDHVWVSVTHDGSYAYGDRWSNFMGVRIGE